MTRLTSGANTFIDEHHPELDCVQVGLGWALDPASAPFDLDVSVFLVKSDGEVRGDYDFIYYNNPVHADGCVLHGGDSLDGAGEGDDETIRLFLKRVPPEIQKLVIGATIHGDQAHSFREVRDAYIRLIDSAGAEIARYDLEREFQEVSAMLFGELYRHNGRWKFRALGMGFTGGLKTMAVSHGVNVQDG